MDQALRKSFQSAQASLLKVKDLVSEICPEDIRPRLGFGVETVSDPCLSTREYVVAVTFPDRTSATRYDCAAKAAFSGSKRNHYEQEFGKLPCGVIYKQKQQTLVL